MSFLGINNKKGKKGKNGFDNFIHSLPIMGVGDGNLNLKSVSKGVANSIDTIGGSAAGVIGELGSSLSVPLLIGGALLIGFVVLKNN